MTINVHAVNKKVMVYFILIIIDHYAISMSIIWLQKSADPWFPTKKFLSPMVNGVDKVRGKWFHSIRNNAKLRSHQGERVLQVLCYFGPVKHGPFINQNQTLFFMSSNRRSKAECTDTPQISVVTLCTCILEFSSLWMHAPHGIPQKSGKTHDDITAGTDTVTEVKYAPSPNVCTPIAWTFRMDMWNIFISMWAWETSIDSHRVAFLQSEFLIVFVHCWVLSLSVNKSTPGSWMRLGSCEVAVSVPGV